MRLPSTVIVRWCADGALVRVGLDCAVQVPFARGLGHVQPVLWRASRPGMVAPRALRTAYEVGGDPAGSALNSGGRSSHLSFPLRVAVAAGQVCRPEVRCLEVVVAPGFPDDPIIIPWSSRACAGSVRRRARRVTTMSRRPGGAG